MDKKIIKLTLIDRQGDIDDSVYFIRTDLSNEELNKISHKVQDVKNNDYTDEDICEALDRAGVEFIHIDHEYILDF